MGVGSLVSYMTNAEFDLLFVLVVIQAIRQRNRVWVETALFFGCATLLVADTFTPFGFVVAHERLVNVINVTLLLVMGFLLVRLINSLAVIPQSVMRFALAGFAILIIAALFVRDADSPYILLPDIVYFGIVVVFAAVVMAAAGLRSNGIARRRMLAVSAGSFFLSFTVMVSGLRAAFPLAPGISHPLIGGPLALTSGLTYFIGFATPRFVRRAWQDRILREFFMRTMTLSRLSDVTEIVFGLETAIRRSHGGSPLWIALWNEDRQSLEVVTQTDRASKCQLDRMTEGKVFSRQQATVSMNLQRDDPTNAAVYRELGVNAIVCAPVSNGNRRFGVLAIYSARAPMFLHDDLEVVSLMADKAATVLEIHEFIEQTTHLRAREEAARLKDDFLAAAAHDLKTPLTAVLMQAHLIQRRLRRRPDAPIDPASIQTLIDQADRLELYVSDLLDVQRIDSQGLTLSRSDVDLSALVSDAATRMPRELHTVRLELQSPVNLNCDRIRILRVIDNLLDNAVKYSPSGGEVVIHLWTDSRNAHLIVRDQGIGIPTADLPHVFDRFHRGGNTEGTSLRGAGIGLYICRAVVEAHGGSISVRSEPGEGSEFHVVLPAIQDRWGEPDASSRGSHSTNYPFQWSESPADSTS